MQTNVPYISYSPPDQEQSSDPEKLVTYRQICGEHELDEGQATHTVPNNGRKQLILNKSGIGGKPPTFVQNYFTP